MERTVSGLSINVGAERVCMEQTSSGSALLPHLTSVSDLNRQRVLALIDGAQALRAADRAEVRQRRVGDIVATLFYEPSTRTRLSFEAAALRLGAQVVGSENALDNSSAKKGERLDDTLRVVGSYVDAVVVRHHEDRTLMDAAAVSPVPVISAGTGAGEHPSQALLDVYTLYREFGRIDGLHITLLGDLRYGRTVHSLVQLLQWFDGIQITMNPIPGFELPEHLILRLKAAGVRVETSTDLLAALAVTDAVYQTRVQTERIPESLRTYANVTKIGAAELAALPKHARILHPLPRIDEIHPAVDSDERAAYFRQAENGLFMRMAILDSLLSGRVNR